MDQLDRLEKIFLDAQAYPLGERERFLEQACNGDLVLLNELRSLLEADQEAEEEAFLKEPALASEERDRTAMDDTWIGPYQILRRLGQGGMGDVFLALQERPFKRRVALKIIRRGMDTEEVLARFHMERQILASLNHPNIARLLDGGRTDEGLPYFAMEYVEGLTLTAYCDKHALPLRERIRLFQHVCSAVHHAHQNLVLHRDLKPSNILVNPQGTVKLLDFGIAKLLNPSLSPIDMPITRTEFRVMTPEYASPEQVRGDTLTTASDVYGLGVILYELLVGFRPYQLKSKTNAAVAAIVLNANVERPSTRVSKSETITRSDGTTETLTPEAIGSMRSITADQLKKTLRGDLDNIVLKSLRKESSRRYGSVEQLSQDLQRYLEGRPVEARPSTVRYQVRKFVGRNRVAVFAACLVLLSLLAGLQVALWQAGIARKQARAAEMARQETENALMQSREVSDFLMGLFSANDPARALGQEITARQLLERGQDRIEELSGQPLVQARMMDVIGRVYQSLGQYDDSKPLLEEALALRISHLGDVHTDVTESLDNLGRFYREKAEYEVAETYYRRALAMREKLYEPGDPAIARSKNNLAIVLRRKGEIDEPEALYRDALAIFKSKYGENEDVANTLNNLAVLVHDVDHEAADSFYSQALDMNVRLFGEVHPEVARVLNNYAYLYKDMGRLDEAEPLMRRAMDIRRKLLGNEHPSLANTINNLAVILREQGRLDEAETFMREALAIRTHALGESHPDVALSLQSISRLLDMKGEYEQAEELARDAYEMQQGFLGSTHLDVARAEENLGVILLHNGHEEEAEQLITQALEIYRLHLEEDHTLIQGALELLRQMP